MPPPMRRSTISMNRQRCASTIATCCSGTAASPVSTIPSWRALIEAKAAGIASAGHPCRSASEPAIPSCRWPIPEAPSIGAWWPSRRIPTWPPICRSWRAASSPIRPNSASFIAHVMLDGKTSEQRRGARDERPGGAPQSADPAGPGRARRPATTGSCRAMVRGPDHKWGQFPRDAQPALDDDRFEALVEMDMDAIEDRRGQPDPDGSPSCGWTIASRTSRCGPTAGSTARSAIAGSRKG